MNRTETHTDLGNGTVRVRVQNVYRRKVDADEVRASGKHSENDTLSVPAVENQKGPKDEVIDGVVVPIPKPAEPEKAKCEHEPPKSDKVTDRDEHEMLPYPSVYQNRFDNSTKTEVNPNSRPPKYSNNFESPSVGIPNSI